MQSLSRRGIRFDRNPTFRPGLAALVELLTGRNYSARAIADIFDFVAVNGTLAGSDVEPEDEADAEAAFVDNLPGAPFDAGCWGHEDAFLDAELLAAGTHPLPFGDGPDAPDGDPALRFPGITSLAERDRLADARRLAADPELAAIVRDEPSLASMYADCLPPISGGAPEAEVPPFEPSESDWEDYRRWMAEVEARDAIRRSEDARNPAYGYE